MRLQRQWPFWVSVAFLLLLATTAFAFWPGIGGSLIFDDLPNLEPWKEFGDLNSWQQVMRFAASGAGTPGRPLSLLSLVIDDQSWPPDIVTLKRTNLALHLINASLVFWLCLLVFRRLLPDTSTARQAVAALFAAAVWALHPLQVSNVSYIIQRMNLLSTLLELAGMVLFFHGRALLASRPARGLLLCSAAIGIFMPVAILAKENGLLLCAFVLLIERFCFAPEPRWWWRAWKLAMLWAPLLLFAVYCLVHYRGFTSGFLIRDFNAWERLLSQGPVVADYLGKLLMPRLHGSGLYFDNFPVSRSLLEPIDTLWSWLALLALLALAWWLRERQKAVAFGLFFFFTGHLMESTVLPLELYYEHRNYLPQAGLWIALAGVLAQVRSPLLQRVFATGGFTLLLMLVIMTRNNAALWANSVVQSAVWYHENPGSLRSTLAYANLLLQARQFETLEQVLDSARGHHPDSLAIVVSQRFVRCYWRDLPTRFDDLPGLARQADYEVASVTMLLQMQDIADQHSNRSQAPDGCRWASRRDLAAVFQALLENPPFAAGRMRASLMEFLAETAVKEGHLSEAIHFYDEAFRGDRLARYPFRQALLLESAGLTREALTYLDRAEAVLTPKQRIVFPDLAERIRSRRTALLEREGRRQ